MGWPCSCGQTYHSQVEYEICKADHRRTRRWALFVVFVIALVIIAVDLGINHWVHGDWRCALPGAHCRLVSPSQ